MAGTQDAMAYNDYPFCLDSYCDGLDDGAFCQRELKEESKSWRSEKYAPVSSVLILDHDKGVGSSKICDDKEIDAMLATQSLIRDNEQAEHQPQLRIILLQPTPHERILDGIQDPTVLKSLLANELISEKYMRRFDPAVSIDAKSPTAEQIAHENGEVPSELNITRTSLLKILTKYDIAPAASSHIRGQEQIFGSRYQMENDNTTIAAFEFWYAIRARLYVSKLGTEADLKMTTLSRYCARTKRTVYILKYRSFNDLPTLLDKELVANLEAFVRSKAAPNLVANPFVLSILHFSPTIQYYRRAAREPRDSTREEERRVHGGSSEIEKVDLRKLHLTLTSLDQDKIQMNFILEVISRLRHQHETFQAMTAARRQGKVERDWLSCRVEEELNRFENQMRYFQSSNEDVARRVERLLDLLFNMSSRISTQSSTQMTHYAMQESASVGTISIVTMLFLPGTFIAGILGTNVVAGPNRPQHDQMERGDMNLVISSQWWILVVATVGLTSGTFCMWWFMRKRYRTMMNRKIKKLSRGHEEV